MLYEVQIFLLKLPRHNKGLRAGNVTLSAKGAGKNAIRLSDLKKITDNSGSEESDDDKKLKKQLAASDKAFKIHFTKTLDADMAKEYCTLAGRRFFRTKYKELKLDIYIF